MSVTYSPEPEGRITATKIMWWLLSVMGTIVFLAVAAWATSINTHASNMENRITNLEQHLSNIDGKLDILIEQTQKK
jgi:hypothetical protein